MPRPAALRALRKEKKTVSLSRDSLAYLEQTRKRAQKAVVNSASHDEIEGAEKRDRRKREHRQQIQRAVVGVMSPPEDTRV